MKALLILAGYSPYQAGFMAPWLWFLLVCSVTYIAAQVDKPLPKNQSQLYRAQERKKG